MLTCASFERERAKKKKKTQFLIFVYCFIEYLFLPIYFCEPYVTLIHKIREQIDTLLFVCLLSHLSIRVNSLAFILLIINYKNKTKSKMTIKGKYKYKVITKHTTTKKKVLWYY